MAHIFVTLNIDFNAVFLSLEDTAREWQRKVNLLKRGDHLENDLTFDQVLQA